MRIAVTGKGGVGKTTIAGTLARFLAQGDRPVLALDVDSNPNLASSLGITTVPSVGEGPGAATVPGGLTEWRRDADGHAYVHLTQPLSELVANYGQTGPGGVRLLVMGEVLKASVGCRCDAHALARGISGHLVDAADIAVLDMEAGLEHLGRGTTEHVDALLVVVEPYYRALEAGTRIRALARDLGLAQIIAVANRVRTPQDREAIIQYCQRHDLELGVVIPFDEAIVAAEASGVAPIDYAPGGPAVQAIGELARMLRTRLS